MAEVDKDRWLKLSPLLDELLDLDGAEARAARLDALRTQDPTLAAELQALLVQQQALEGSDFLARPPPLQGDAPGVAAGQQLGAYTLEREIGRGGMGTVWLARRSDGRFEGQVAIKLLHSGGFGHGDAGRFAREGEILARLSHPHIARLLDAGLAPQDQQPYLVLEYVDGETINQHCEQRQLGVAARVTLFLDVLAAVAHAHNRLILHRDLKPSNILVTKTGEVKLLDFGIAKLLGDATQAEQGAAATELTRRAGRAYTLQYAAPEQVQGGDVTTATDVYALGVLLYLLLSGAHPTAGSTESELDRLREVVEVEPRRLSEQVLHRKGLPEARKRARELRGDLDTILARALKKAPAERYPTAEALAQDLRHWLAHEPITARPDSAGYRIAKFVRRHRLGVAAGSVALLAVAAGAGVALWKANEAHEQRIEAEGLIEFMLGDLRKKLEPVGRLDVLDAVGDKALAYYARQDLGRSDADALGRRARALHLMGEIADLRGKMDEAEQLFAQAAQSTGEMLARDPKNAQRLFDHAQSSYWVGYAARRRGRLEEAERRFQQYLQLSSQLSALAPQRLDWRSEAPSAGVNLGVLQLESGRAAEAQRSLAGAAHELRQLVGSRPELRSELAVTYGWMAKAHEALGDYAQALQAQRDKAAVFDAAARDDSQAKHLLANAAFEIGSLHLMLGQLGDALRSAEDAATMRQSLLVLEPGNREWLQQWCFTRLLVAEIALGSDDAPAARRALADARPTVEKLIRLDARKISWQVKLRGLYLTLRARTAMAAERGAAEVELGDYLGAVPGFESQGKSLKPEYARIAADAQLALGELLHARGAAAQAQEQWAAAAARLDTPAHHGDPASTALRALAQLRLGQIQEARNLADSLQATAYRHPRLRELTMHLRK